MTDYKMLCAQLRSLTEGVPHPVANLANAAAAIGQALDTINWAGFYTLEDEMLVLGPFCGKPACIEIPIGKGVCGTAVKRGETVVVPDVHAFPGHIACDSASRSEIVIPLWKNDTVIGVLDIDSPITNRFSEVDRVGLESAAKIIEASL